MDNLRGVKPIVQTPPDLSGQARVDLRKKDFEAVIWGKSYDVLLDKSIKCPCRNLTDHQPIVNCRNCGGTGWVFYNRKESKVVIQSLNLDTKYKEWSEEKIGMAKMTFLNKESITHMDRVTVKSAVMLTTELLHPTIWENSKLMCKSIYDIIDIEHCFLFQGVNVPLKLLEENVDFTIEKGQYIVLNDSLYTENCTISLRYTHNPAYHVIDLPRSVMSTPEYSKSKGRDVVSDMPLLANVRLSHYVLDLDTYNGDWLIDNSEKDFCKLRDKI